jgi:hypothetical protein
MKLFRFNPTIRETNKYLSKTVDELLKKHSGVSNEDFERDLVSITGIGWKQVKNYKSHPKPSERLKDNSVVIKYIRDCQKRDSARKARHVALAVGSLTVIGIFGYRLATSPNKVEAFAVHEVAQPLPNDYSKAETKVFLEIRNFVLRLGPVKHSKVPLDKFSCSKLPAVGLTNCSLSETGSAGLFQIVLIMDHDFVRRYSVTSVDSNEIEKLRLQLVDRVDSSLASDDAKPLSQKQFKVGDESVQVISNPPGPGSRAMLNVTVSFSSL